MNRFATMTPSTADIELGDYRLTVSIEEIGPMEAEIMLGANVRNRKRSRGHVRRLAAAMVRGEWCLNGETIVIDTAGDLVDGQHRLRAIVNSGKTLSVLVVRGVEPILAQDTTGTGMHRTLGGQLSVHDEESSPVLAAALAVVHRLTIDRGWTGTYPTNIQGLRLLEQHPDLRSGCIVGGRANRAAIRFSNGTATALYYLFRTVDEDDAEAFWERLIAGVGLAMGDPILALRNILLKEANLPVGRQRTLQRNMVALTIKAWLMWRRGDECKILRWRAGGSKAEPFPQYDEQIDTGTA